MTRLPRQPGWPTLDDRALHGLPGDVVATLGPHTEADPVALLADFLVSFGSAVGAGPRFMVGGTAHYPRENVCLVGRTSKARKGTARAEIREVMMHADPQWSSERVVSGISSGEGLIAAVRDGTSEEDKGEEDKRLLVVESEFARPLAVAGREGSIVSPTVRDCWDTGTLRTLTRKDALKATNAHVSILGHITVEELTRCLSDTEIANGFANRFSFFLVDRSQLLPSGGSLEAETYAGLGRTTQCALDDSRRFGRLRRTSEAEDLWRFLYGVIAAQDVGGLLGSVTARAEAHLLRFALLYAVTDASPAVELDHLEAAWSLLCYADDSARFIFGTALGDPIADGILRKLRELPEGQGLDGTEQRDLFGRHAKGKQLEAARLRLAELGLVDNITAESSGGRPRIVTFLRGDESDQGDQSRDMSLRSLRSQQEKVHA